MAVRLMNVALLAALVLACLRLWQFLGEAPPALPLPVTAAATSASPPTPEGSRDPKADAAEPRPEAYDLIVARDLFSATRGVVIPVPAATAAPAPKPQPTPKLTLYGVVMLDGEKSAYLQEGSHEARPRKVHENDAFAGGIVKSIRADGVSFLFAGREINISLRTPKDGATAAPLPGGQDPGIPVQSAPEPGVFRRSPAPPGGVPGQMAVPGNARQSIPGILTGNMPVLPPGEGSEEADEPRWSTPEVPPPGAADEEGHD